MATTYRVDTLAATVHPDQDFLRFLSKGRFMLQRSQSSGRYVFPPRVAEPGTGSRDLLWVQASGLGSLYSITFVSQKDQAKSYNIALVDLAEGPRILTRIEGVAPATAPIGLSVCARIITENREALLVFEPVGQSINIGKSEAAP